MRYRSKRVDKRLAVTGMIATVTAVCAVTVITPISSEARADFGSNFAAGASNHVQTMMRPSDDGWDADIAAQSIDPDAGPLANDLEFSPDIRGQVQAGDTFNYTQTIQITPAMGAMADMGIDTWSFLIGTRHWSWAGVNSITLDSEAVGFTSEILDDGGDLILSFDTPIPTSLSPVLAFDLDVVYENASRPFSLSTLQLQQTADMVALDTPPTPTSIPEPASLMLLGCAGVAVSGYRRARRNSRGDESV